MGPVRLAAATVSTGDAAELAGVATATVRSWVMKGWLRPVPRLDPARRHHLFLTADVIRCEHEHRSRVRRAGYRRAQAQWRSMVADC